MSTARRFALLALAVAAPTLAIAERPDAVYSPAALEDRKQACTIKGQLSAVCLEFYTDIYIKYSRQVDRDVQDDLSRCFASAKHTDQQGVERDSVFYANRFFERQVAGDADVKNKYVDECIALTEQVVPGWTNAAKTDVARTAFHKRLRSLLESDFASKCGQKNQQAGLRDDEEPFSIVVGHRPPKGNRTVFFKDTDPDGNTVSVLCNGFVVGKTKTGKAINVAPATFSERLAARNASSKRCLHECLHNTSAPDRACYPELRQGIVTPACMEHCRSACGVQ